jgi:hypothetical protein
VPTAPPSGSITLDQVVARTDVLTVACTRCERAGRYPVTVLIARHGLYCDVPEMLRRLSADCPKRASISTYDICGIHCPDLSYLFLARPVIPNG